MKASEAFHHQLSVGMVISKADGCVLSLQLDLPLFLSLWCFLSTITHISSNRPFHLSKNIVEIFVLASEESKHNYIILNPLSSMHQEGL